LCVHPATDPTARVSRRGNGVLRTLHPACRRRAGGASHARLLACLRMGCEPADRRAPDRSIRGRVRMPRPGDPVLVAEPGFRLIRYGNAEEAEARASASGTAAAGIPASGA